MKKIIERLAGIEKRLEFLECGNREEDAPVGEYADINGIFLKRKNETLRYCEHFTQEEALRLFEDSEKKIPTKEEWTQMLKAGCTYDYNLKGIWMGHNHFSKKETQFSTFLPSEGLLFDTRGSFNYRGINGYYWSSKGTDTIYDWCVTFFSGGQNISNTNSDYGLSVRCIRRYATNN
jgi:uncharacterized protein (TIGR02145 family)